MMTKQQIAKYGKTWGSVCKANQWRMERGRFASGEDNQSLLHTEVMHIAEQISRQNHRAVQLEDLRKACAGRITGKVQSAKKLTNRQFDRLLVLFQLLIDPDDISAMVQWQSYENVDSVNRSFSGHIALDRDLPDDPGERRCLVYAIENTIQGEDYVKHICRDQFKTDNWRELSLQQLRWLAQTLRARRITWNRSGRKRQDRNTRALAKHLFGSQAT